MTSSVPDLRRPLAEASTWYAALVAGTRDDQLAAPTPCVDYDVRTLMAHMSVVLDKITGFGSDHKDLYADHDASPEEQARAREDRAAAVVDGHTPQERADAVRAQVAAAESAWTDDTLTTRIQLGWGPILPGGVVTAIYLMEVLAHAWDLATATGQPAEAPGPLGAIGYETARQTLPAGETRAGFPFDDPVEPAADAGPTERMANWTGRVSRPSQA